METEGYKIKPQWRAFREGETKFYSFLHVLYTCFVWPNLHHSYKCPAFMFELELLSFHARLLCYLSLACPAAKFLLACLLLTVQPLVWMSRSFINAWLFALRLTVVIGLTPHSLPSLLGSGYNVNLLSLSFYSFYFQMEDAQSKHRTEIRQLCMALLNHSE